MPVLNAKLSSRILLQPGPEGIGTGGAPDAAFGQDPHAMILKLNQTNRNNVEGEFGDAQMDAAVAHQLIMNLYMYT